MLIEKKVYKNVDNEIIEEIKAHLEKWCDDRFYDGFEIIVVLYELYNNGIKYSEKPIEIIIKLYSHSIVMRVKDQGEGFNVQEKLNVNACDLKKNIHKPCGRGIYIVKNFVSQIYYNKKGNQVVVKIKENK
ncbi:MAG TPA: ATP-binding protein [Clostridia bacterium]|nr:ATP-binding protein [Clostridia bacterium]